MGPWDRWGSPGGGGEGVGGLENSGGLLFRQELRRGRSCDQISSGTEGEFGNVVRREVTIWRDVFSAARPNYLA